MKLNEKPFQLTDPPDFTPSFVNNAPKPQIIETRPPETIQNYSKQKPKSPVKIRLEPELIISKSPQKMLKGQKRKHQLLEQIWARCSSSCETRSINSINTDAAAEEK